MGVRKKIRAQQIKDEKKQVAFAKLTGCPTSPRKMRLVADLVRGVEVEKALQILKFNVKESSINLEKLFFHFVAYFLEYAKVKSHKKQNDLLVLLRVQH